MLSGSTRLTGSALSFGGAVSGAQDLQLRTDTLAIGSSVAGTGEFSIAPLDAARTIGVAGGAGGLQLSRAALDGTSGFSHLTIGRTDGSGAVNAGAWRLHADTTLQSRSGDLNLNGSVDGGFALALNTGATTRIAGPVGATTALRSLSLDNNAAAADWNGTSGERTLFDQADSTGAARVITSGAQTYADPVVAMVPVVFNGGAISAALAGNQFAKAISANADTLQLRSTGPIEIGTLTLAHGGSVETDGVLKLDGALRLAGGTLMLVSNATPTPGDFADPELQGRTLAFGLVPIKEASATITQGAGSTLSSAAGSLLVLRSPKGGSMQLDQPGNTLLGELSAVSGTLGEQGSARFDSAASPTLSFIRIASSELHVAGAPPSDGSQTLQQAGLEADALKLSADVLATGPTGQIRARLPFDNAQGSQTAVPGLTLVLSPTALQTGTGFGTSSPEGWIQVSIGNDKGGYITARPKGEGGVNAFVLLGGALGFKPFYDGSGKLGEIRIFYNGDAPRTPQEAGALTAVLAVIEDARHARFEEAVRTENVSARLRSGVIAEVGAGRPATVGRESIRLPQNCEVKPGSLNCQ